MNDIAPQFMQVPNSQVAFVGTEPIPTGPYYLPEYYELEREAIFKRVWLQMGRESELPRPGSYIVRSIEAANASVLVARGADGRIRAFHNVCAHRGTRLVMQPAGEATSFRCRYHQWNFGLDGALLNVPDIKSFFDLDPSENGLIEIPLDTCGGFLFVNLERSPGQDLRDFLGPLASELDGLVWAKHTVFSEYTYEVAANWKTTYDNFQELYHLRSIHSKTVTMTGRGDNNPFGYPKEYFFSGPHRGMSLGANSSHTSEGARDKTYWYYGVFPNLFVFGAPLGPFTHEIWPLGVDRTRGIVRVFYSGPDASAAQRYQRELETFKLLDIHTEDFSMVEQAQMGLRSGALEHIHFQAQEALCRHLYLTVDGMVNDYRAERDRRAENVDGCGAVKEA